MLLAIWVATPKVFIHALFHHNHSSTLNKGETTVKQQPSADCEFEKYNKPVYFSLFKFICSFIPQRPASAITLQEMRLNFSQLSYVISFLRGPPGNK
jgi:hypothetical protein